MPNYWTRFSTNTAPALRGKKPGEQKRAIHGIVHRNGAALDEVFFDAEGGAGYALIHVPGNRAEQIDIDGILAEIEGQDTIKLLKVEEVET